MNSFTPSRSQLRQSREVSRPLRVPHGDISAAFNPVEEPLDPIPIEEAAKADRIASAWPEAVIRCRWCEIAPGGQTAVHGSEMTGSFSAEISRDISGKQHR